ncbi:LuxR C-terminal-related transcriptional regulator [Actinomadura sp. 6N118]|uniref:helix-turn-helix transcriptional regulator n=1 Tax=Actinomadura sp. 6N118 TaxID=3375151 RepID=UPI0037937959
MTTTHLTKPPAHRPPPTTPVRRHDHTPHPVQPDRPRRLPRPSAHADIDAALATATREVVVLCPLSAATGEPIGIPRQVDHDNLRRGVRYRVLFPDRARVVPALAARLKALALAGADVRTVPEVPGHAVIIDGALAVLPGERHGDEPATGVAMLRLRSVVEAITWLSTQAWAAAVPIGTCGVHEHGELSDREREVLKLLAEGYTDTAVAVKLEVSVRTVRRSMATIMSRLGARSRFQAGLKAADRGWPAEANR